MSDENTTPEGASECAEKSYRFILSHSFFVSIFLFSFFLIQGVGLNRLHSLVDNASLIFTFGPVLALWIASPGWRLMGRVLRCVITGIVTSENEADLAENTCTTTGTVVMLTGVIGIVIGAINMLSSGMYSPECATMGLAVCLITVVYGLVGWVICLMARARIRQARYVLRDATLSPQSHPGFISNYWLLRLVIFGIIIIILLRNLP